MATYEPTRDGLKQLRKDLKHGAILRAKIPGDRDYGEFKFTGNRLSGYMADGMTEHAVLLHYGPLQGVSGLRRGA